MTENKNFLLAIAPLHNILINFLFTNITPENHSSAEDKIQSCCHFRIVNDSSHFLTIQSYLSNIMSAGEQQARVTFCSFTTCRIPWIFKITSGTTTLEGTFFILAKLRAAARFQTFINIWKNIIIKIFYMISAQFEN